MVARSTSLCYDTNTSLRPPASSSACSLLPLLLLLLLLHQSRVFVATEQSVRLAGRKREGAPRRDVNGTISRQSVMISDGQADRQTDRQTNDPDQTKPDYPPSRPADQLIGRPTDEPTNQPTSQQASSRSVCYDSQFVTIFSAPAWGKH
ncbi:hypothetical protein P5V15_013034 [Pogonomyrmex californicus]